jgi:hypothetical protein
MNRSTTLPAFALYADRNFVVIARTASSEHPAGTELLSDPMAADVAPLRREPPVAPQENRRKNTTGQPTNVATFRVLTRPTYESWRVVGGKTMRR